MRMSELNYADCFSSNVLKELEDLENEKRLEKKFTQVIDTASPPSNTDELVDVFAKARRPSLNLLSRNNGKKTPISCST